MKEKLALLYRVARRPRDAVKLEAWAQRLRVSLKRLVNKEGLIFDGLNWKGQIVRQTSIHAQMLALMAQLKGIDEAAVFEKIVLPFVRGESNPKVTPSAYWITYVFSILQEKGFGAEVVTFIKEKWAPMAEHGTTWENFAPRRGDESFSHAWSAHPLYHLMQTIGGIIQTAPACSQIRYRPVFIGERNETVIPSPKGRIVGRWQKIGDEVEVELILPAGVRAQVELPGIRARGAVTGGKWRLKLGHLQG